MRLLLTLPNLGPSLRSALVRAALEETPSFNHGLGSVLQTPEGLLFTTPDFPDSDDGDEARAKLIREILEAAVAINQRILRMFPQLPELYRSKVRFRSEPQVGLDVIPDYLTLLHQGGGDCAPLGAVRCAELRSRGIPSGLKVYWRPERTPLPYHVQVRVVRGSDVDIEDPARMLGMAGMAAH